MKENMRHIETPDLSRPENREWIRIAKSLKLLRDQFSLMDEHGDAIQPDVFTAMLQGLRYAASEVVMATTKLEKADYAYPDRFVGQNFDVYGIDDEL